VHISNNSSSSVISKQGSNLLISSNIILLTLKKPIPLKPVVYTTLIDKAAQLALLLPTKPGHVTLRYSSPGNPLKLSTSTIGNIADWKYLIEKEIREYLTAKFNKY
jgi:hypothetical protein